MAKGQENDTPQAAIALSPEQFEQLLKVLTERSAKESSPEMSLALAAVQASVKATEKFTDAVNRTRRISNADAQGISALTYDSRCHYCQRRERHPDTNKIAHPKPRLKYEVFFCDGRLVEKQLTPLEIELLNSFTEARQARDGKWTAVLDRDGSARRLMIKVPYGGLDDRIGLPSLVQICAELLHGPKIADPNAAAALIIELQSRVALLEQQAREKGIAVPGEPVAAAQ